MMGDCVGIVCCVDIKILDLTEIVVDGFVQMFVFMVDVWLYGY